MSQLVQPARLQEAGQKRLRAGLEYLELAESHITQARLFFRPLVGPQAKLLHDRCLQLADTAHELLALARALDGQAAVSEDWILTPRHAFAAKGAA